MAGIGDEGERAGKKAAHPFDDHEAEGQDEAEQHRPFVGVGHFRRMVVVAAMVVPVPVIVATAMVVDVVMPLMLTTLMGIPMPCPMIVTMTVMLSPGLAFACLRRVPMFDRHFLLLAHEHRRAERGWHPPRTPPTFLRP